MRKSQNTINGLISSHGDWAQDPAGMANIILHYFDGLFATVTPSPEEI